MNFCIPQGQIGGFCRRSSRADRIAARRWTDTSPDPQVAPTPAIISPSPILPVEDSDHLPGTLGIADLKSLELPDTNNNNNEIMNNHMRTYGYSRLSLQPEDIPVDWNISIFPDNVTEIPLSDLYEVPSEEEMLEDILGIIDTDFKAKSGFKL